MAYPPWFAPTGQGVQMTERRPAAAALLLGDLESQRVAVGVDAVQGLAASGRLALAPQPAARTGVVRARAGRQRGGYRLGVGVDQPQRIVAASAHDREIQPVGPVGREARRARRAQLVRPGSTRFNPLGIKSVLPITT